MGKISPHFPAKTGCSDLVYKLFEFPPLLKMIFYGTWLVLGLMLFPFVRATESVSLTGYYRSFILLLSDDICQPFDETTITAPDGSISAKFVAFGATMTELWVRDKYDHLRDVILGYDDNSKLLTDPGHPVYISVLFCRSFSVWLTCNNTTL